MSPCSWTVEESQVESCEHQDNADVHRQAFPESVSEEREIHTDDDGRHCHYIKRDGDPPAHFSLHGLYLQERTNFCKKDYFSDYFRNQHALKSPLSRQLGMSASRMPGSRSKGSCRRPF